MEGGERRVKDLCAVVYSEEVLVGGCVERVC